MITIKHKNIPNKLKDKPSFVLWRPESRSGKVTKVPVNPKTLEDAKSNDPSTWSSYLVATEVLAKNKGYGLGYMFTKESRIVGIDLDHCIDNGSVAPWAQEIVEAFSSYTEISPSGSGIHIFVEGDLPDGRRRKGSIEVYDSGRFFTLTGNVLGEARDIVQCDDQLKAFHAKSFGEEEVAAATAPADTAKSILSDEDLLQAALASRNGFTFEALWKGEYPADRYGSQSEADAALAMMLAFWTRKDPEAMDRLFRQSALYRPKWDELRGKLTYGQITINRAIQKQKDIYSPHINEGWEPPIAFNNHVLPQFPSEVLPDWVAQFVEDIAEAAQVPKDLPAMLSLSILAASVAKRCSIRRDEGWKEPLNLYTVVALPPASRKSAVFSWMSEPLVEYEKHLIHSKKVWIEQQKNERKIKEGKRAGLQAKLSKIGLSASEEDLLNNQLNRITAELADSKEPTLPRLITDNTTPEKLASLLAEQDGRMTLLSAEGDVFSIMNGQYVNGKGAAEISVFLKGHAGDDLRRAC